MIESICKANLDEVLPLIKQYQAFYEVDHVEDDRNRRFFAQFDEHSDKGCLFGYRQDGRMVAFATVYFSFASTITAKVAILNDLFVLQAYRRRGIAKILIAHCEMFAKSKGAARLQWVTAADNKEAIGLYRSLGARQSSWEFFSLDE